jgi:hypothetical protein
MVAPNKPAGLDSLAYLFYFKDVNENILPKLLLTMEQLTLEQAALIHANKPYHGPIDKVRNISFQKGAEWQKEQDTQLMHNMIKALLSVQKYLHYKEECDGRGLGHFPHPKHEVSTAIQNYLHTSNETIDSIVSYKQYTQD